MYKFIRTALCRLANSLCAGSENAAANTANTNRLIRKETNNAMAEKHEKKYNVDIKGHKQRYGWKSCKIMAYTNRSIIKESNNDMAEKHVKSRFTQIGW